MARKTANTTLALVGLASLVAFFMPFLDLGGLVSASGWEILVGDHTDLTTRIALISLTLGSLSLIVAGATGSNGARLVGFGFGAGVLGFMGYQVVKFFFATTGLGLWLTMGAAVVALVAAFGAKKR